LYKSSSEAKVIKMAKHTMSDVRTERKKVQLYTTRKRFKISNVCDNPHEGISEIARTGLDGLASVRDGKRRVIITNWLEASYCKYPRRGGRPRRARNVSGEGIQA